MPISDEMNEANKDAFQKGSKIWVISACLKGMGITSLSEDLKHTSTYEG